MLTSSITFLLFTSWRTLLAETVQNILVRELSTSVGLKSCPLGSFCSPTELDPQDESSSLCWVCNDVQLMNNLDWGKALEDIKEAAEFLREEGSAKLGVISFCMGQSSLVHQSLVSHLWVDLLYSHRAHIVESTRLCTSFEISAFCLKSNTELPNWMLVTSQDHTPKKLHTSFSDITTLQRPPAIVRTTYCWQRGTLFFTDYLDVGGALALLAAEHGKAEGAISFYGTPDKNFGHVSITPNTLRNWSRSCSYSIFIHATTYR